MTNKNLLKAKIIEQGMTVTQIATLLGMSREAFYNRLNNVTEFKASEIRTLSSILKIKNIDVYFFNA